MPATDEIRQIQETGYSILRAHLSQPLIDSCREAFWPVFLAHITAHEPNRGPFRHFLPLPFKPPIYAAEFFFDPSILDIVRGVMGDRIVADQWGCDVPVQGSEYQEPHVDFRRPLFEEAP